MTKMIKEEQKPAIIAYYLAPHSLRDTEQEFGIDRHSISKFLKGLGILRSKLESHKLAGAKTSYAGWISLDTQLQIQADYMSGTPKSTLAQNYKLTKTAIAWITADCDTPIQIKKKKSSLYYNFLETDIQQIIDYYLLPKSLKETARKFNCSSTKPILRILNEYNVPKHTVKVARQLANTSTKQTCLRKYGVECTGSIPNLIAKRKQTCLAKYGAASFMQTAEFKEKTTRSNLEKYGTKFYLQSVSYKNTSKKRYKYNNVSFDSSWELALWIYAIDHNESIEREPEHLRFVVNGTTHYYTPDFRYKGQLVEIKGDHMLGHNGEIIDFYNNCNKKVLAKKNKIIKEYNIKILSRTDLKPVFSYITAKYGKKYLASFKTSDKKTDY